MFGFVLATYFLRGDRLGPATTSPIALNFLICGSNANHIFDCYYDYSNFQFFGSIQHDDDIGVSCQPGI